MANNGLLKSLNINNVSSTFPSDLSVRDNSNPHKLLDSPFSTYIPSESTAYSDINFQRGNSSNNGQNKYQYNNIVSNRQSQTSNYCNYRTEINQYPDIHNSYKQGNGHMESNMQFSSCSNLVESYRILIETIIEKSPYKRVSVNAIYEYIIQNHPNLATNKQRLWSNICTNLNRKNFFTKINNQYMLNSSVSDNKNTIKNANNMPPSASISHQQNLPKNVYTTPSSTTNIPIPRQISMPKVAKNPPQILPNQMLGEVINNYDFHPVTYMKVPFSLWIPIYHFSNFHGITQNPGVSHFNQLYSQLLHSNYLAKVISTNSNTWPPAILQPDMPQELRIPVNISLAFPH